MSTPTTIKPLIIPISVDALRIGQNDAHLNADKLAAHHADFSSMSYAAHGTTFNKPSANLSADLAKSTFASRDSIAQGIHIHWALPDALLQGKTSDSGELSFHNVPNRWLVTRIVKSTNGGPAQSSWVVESDYLAPEPTSGQGHSRTLPFGTESDLSDYGPQYIGRNTPADQWSPAKPSEVFPNLTALGYGIPIYHAYQAECPNVFSFYDSLSGLDPGPITISYVVTGWYSDPANSPIDLTKKLIGETELPWSFSDATIPPDNQLLFSGCIHNVTYDATKEYIANSGSLAEASVAIGQSTAQAVSALMASQLNPGDDPDIEFYLNALQNGVLSKHQSVDGQAYIEEILHSNEFGNTSGGKIWVVQQKVLSDAAAIKKPVQAIEITLSPVLAKDLNELNLLQQQLDKLKAEMYDAQWQLFSDWTKYMVVLYGNKAPGTKYPDSQATKDYLTKKMAALTSDTGYTAQIKKLESQIETAKQTISQKIASDQELLQTSAPRYWHANDPVLVFHGKDIAKTKRYGADTTFADDGLLKCRWPQEIITKVKLSDELEISSKHIKAKPLKNNIPYFKTINKLIREAILLDENFTDHVLTNASGKALKRPAKKLKTQQANFKALGEALSPLQYATPSDETDGFNPIILQWEIDFYPFENMDSSEPGAVYNPDLINEMYTLDKYAVDYELQNGVTIPTLEKEVYQGSISLSPNPLTNLKNQINRYIKKNPDDTIDDELKAILATIDDIPMVSQALSGFNNSLLMKDQTFQIPVRDVFVPKAFRQIWEFTNVLIRGAVGKANNMSGLPLNSFNPMKAGLAKLVQLRLVDVFGRTRMIDISHLIVANHLKPNPNFPDLGQYLYMPPRITQPSRLLFRWVSAINDEMESNIHPASSPVCGWIRPNHLDNSLQVYNADGTSIGSMVIGGTPQAPKVLWFSTPGTAIKTFEESFADANPHLTSFATALYQTGKGFTYIEELIQVIDQTHNFINPANFNQNKNLALLTGRPIAIVRASLKLDLQGNPATNQSWPTFNNQVENGTPKTTNGFDKIKIPVRLGDLSQFNDGLIGYYKETGGTVDYKTFYAEVAQEEEYISPPPANNIQLTAADSEAQFVTMLVDPRASIHATSGILPVKSIDIPTGQYASALNKMELYFLTTPILQSSNKLSLPYPKEKGFEWSFAAYNGTEWSSTDKIKKTDATAHLDYTPQSITEGWMILNKTTNETDEKE